MSTRNDKHGTMSTETISTRNFEHKNVQHRKVKHGKKIKTTMKFTGKSMNVSQTKKIKMFTFEFEYNQTNFLRGYRDLAFSHLLFYKNYLLRIY